MGKRHSGDESGSNPIIDGCGVSFTGNSAADAGSTDDDNNADTFGTSRSALMAPCAAAGPAIAVTGNGQAIDNGDTTPDTTPDTTDGTALGAVAVGSSGSARTFSIANTGNLALGVTSLSLTGANPGDFGHSGNPGNIAVGDAVDVALSLSPVALDLGRDIDIGE